MCVFAVEPRQEIEELGKDADEVGLSAVATRHTTTTSSPVQVRSLHATPLPRAECEPAGSAAAACGRIFPVTLKGGLARVKKMAGKCQKSLLWLPKMKIWTVEAKRVVK